MSRENDLIIENLMQTSSGDSDEEEDDAVELGLVKKVKVYRVPSPFKTLAGGFPGWLDPINLPSGTSNICGICDDPLQFLFQCLLRDKHEQQKRPSDNQSRSVKVFRCQLPRSNRFYPYEVSDHHGKDKGTAAYHYGKDKGTAALVTSLQENLPIVTNF